MASIGSVQQLGLASSGGIGNGSRASTRGMAAAQTVSPRRCCSEFHGSGVHASRSSVVFNLERSLVKGRAIGCRRRPARGQGLVVRGIFGLGVPELAVIAGVAAILFGPKKLPEIGKSLGKTVKSFQQAAKEFESEVKSAASEGTITESAETETPPTPTTAPPPAPKTVSAPSDKDSL